MVTNCDLLASRNLVMSISFGLWPHILYGTVDATPLFMCALTETERWTRDHQFTDEMLPAADRKEA